MLLFHTLFISNEVSHAVGVHLLFSSIITDVLMHQMAKYILSKFWIHRDSLQFVMTESSFYTTLHYNYLYQTMASNTTLLLLIYFCYLLWFAIYFDCTKILSLHMNILVILYITYVSAINSVDVWRYCTWDRFKREWMITLNLPSPYSAISECLLLPQICFGSSIISD